MTLIRRDSFDSLVPVAFVLSTRRAASAQKVTQTPRENFMAAQEFSPVSTFDASRGCVFSAPRPSFYFLNFARRGPCYLQLYPLSEMPA